METNDSFGAGKINWKVLLTGIPGLLVVVMLPRITYGLDPTTDFRGRLDAAKHHVLVHCIEV